MRFGEGGGERAVRNWQYYSDLKSYFLKCHDHFAELHNLQNLVYGHQYYYLLFQATSVTSVQACGVTSLLSQATAFSFSFSFWDFNLTLNLAMYFSVNATLDRRNTFKILINILSAPWGAGLAQWWERSLPTNVSRVRFPDPGSYVSWVYWSLVPYSAPRSFSPGAPVFPSPQIPLPLNLTTDFVHSWCNKCPCCGEAKSVKMHGRPNNLQADFIRIMLHFLNAVKTKLVFISIQESCFSYTILACAIRQF